MGLQILLEMSYYVLSTKLKLAFTNTIYFSQGTGKSATISKCTRRPVSSGNGRDRVTIRCAKYDLRPDAREELEQLQVPDSSLQLLWVDTVGWDDADLQGKLSASGGRNFIFAFSNYFS